MVSLFIFSFNQLTSLSLSLFLDETIIETSKLRRSLRNTPSSSVKNPPLVKQKKQENEKNKTTG
jgi:hypothetical protein